MPKVKKIVLAGLLLAILIIFSRFFSIQLNVFLRINFAFVPFIIAGTLLGPVWSALIGAVGDVLGFLIFPSGGGAFFPGFTFNALLTGLVYGFFLYNRPNNKSYLIRLIISVLIVNIFIQLGLNTLWLAIMYKRAFMAPAAIRFVAKFIEVPVEIASMYAVKIFLDKPVKKYLFDNTDDDNNTFTIDSTREK